MEKIDSKKIYQEVISKFVTRCTGVEGIISIMLTGSVARGDFKPGWSDIDMIVVVKDECKESIKKIGSIANEVSKNIKLPLRSGRPMLDLWADTLSGALSWLGKGFEYYNFIKIAKVLYGIDLRRKIKRPSQNQLRELAIKELKKQVSLINGSSKESKESLEQRILNIFDFLFPILRIALAFKGVYVSSKRDITREALRAFKSIPKIKTVRQAYDLWINWEKLRKEDYPKEFCEDVQKFAFALYKYIGIIR